MNPSQHNSRVYAATCLATVALAFAAPTAEATLLAGWDFQGTTDPSGPIGTVISMPPNTPRDFTANAGAFQASSHLYLDGTNGSSSFIVGTANGVPGSSELGALNGITANTAGTNFATGTGSPTGGSMALFNLESVGLGSINGKSAVFKLSMDGYQGLEFSFAVQRPNDTSGGGYGVNVFDFSYSVDGANFLPWGSITTGGAAAVSNQAYTLSPILQAVNDADLVFVRMTMSGATGFNSTRVDNIQFNATAVPEPCALAGLLTGIGVVFLRRRRAAQVA